MKWWSVLACLCVISPAWAEGPTTIGGVEYAAVDPGPVFVEEPRPPQDWLAPEPTARENKAGVQLFRTQDPGEYTRERVLKAEERVETLDLALTPGESIAHWFGFRALDDLGSVSVEVAEVPGVEFEVRRIHCWPQRTTWFNSRTYQVLPELLLKQEGGQTEHPLAGGVLEWRAFDVPTGETVGLWITAKAAADARPGTRTTSVTLTSAGREPIALPLAVEVYPFTLPERLDDRRWILYCWPNRYKAGADPALDIRDMVEHGIDGFLDNAYLMVKVEKGEGGEIRIQDHANSIRWVEKIIGVAQKEGMRGPFGLWTTPVNRELAKAYGVDMTKPWPAEMHEGVRRVKAYFDEQYAALGIGDWMSFASDEPKPGNVYAIEAMKAWQQAGARTYCTAYTGTYEETAAWITDANIGYGDRSSRALVHEHHARQWVIGDGTYMGPHEMARHRRRAGLHFFLTDAYGCAIWRWGGVHGDPFNDFDGLDARPTEPADQILAYPQMAEANNWKTYLGPIPTIAWESIRDGINDFKYLVVLERAIEQARAGGDEAARVRAEAAAGVLDRLREEFLDSAEVAQGKNVFKIDTPSLMNIRRWAATEIMTLRHATAVGAAASGPTGGGDVTVVVSPKLNVAARNATLLAPPLLSIPRAERAPRIDGMAAEREWADASRASIPASAPTEARIMYDDEYLYLAWKCDEPAMDRITPADQASDTGPIWSQDSVELFIAPTDVRHQPAHLMINHLGRWMSESTAVREWDAQATVAARHEPDGFVIEVAVPWRALEEVAPRPWGTVALNLCRVRNLDTREEDRGKFNWAYGTGNFHQPERFGIGVLDDSEIQLVELSCEAGEDGVFNLVAEVRNRSGRPVFPKIEKLKGRNLQLTHRGGMPKDGSRAIQPGKTGRAVREIPLRQRREQWAFRWSPSPNGEPIEVEFTAPGTADLHALSLERQHHVAVAGGLVTIEPLLASTQKGYVKVSTADSEGLVLPLGTEHTERSFTTPAPGGVAKVRVEVLGRERQPLTREDVSILVLPR